MLGATPAFRGMAAELLPSLAFSQHPVLCSKYQTRSGDEPGAGDNCPSGQGVAKMMRAGSRQKRPVGLSILGCRLPLSSMVMGN